VKGVILLIRKCVCGRTIDVDSQLCSKHKKEFGTDSAKWPEWLKDWIKNYQRELDQEKNHLDLAYRDSRYYETAPGCYSTRALIHDPEDDNDDSGYIDDLIETEYDEWGNEIENIDGFSYVDIDKQINKEKAFDRRLEAINKGYYKLRPPKGKEVERLRKERLETHLYEDRNKY